MLLRRYTCAKRQAASTILLCTSGVHPLLASWNGLHEKETPSSVFWVPLDQLFAPQLYVNVYQERRRAQKSIECKTFHSFSGTYLNHFWWYSSAQNVEKNNKRLKGADALLVSVRQKFERVRSFWAEKAGTWLAIDFEAWEMDHTVITECGWSYLQWKEGNEIAANGHYILEEHKFYTNGKYVPNMRDVRDTLSFETLNERLLIGSVFPRNTPLAKAKWWRSLSSRKSFAKWLAISAAQVLCSSYSTITVKMSSMCCCRSLCQDVPQDCVQISEATGCANREPFIYITRHNARRWHLRCRHNRALRGLTRWHIWEDEAWKDVSSSQNLHGKYT